MLLVQNFKFFGLIHDLILCMRFQIYFWVSIPILWNNFAGLIMEFFSQWIIRGFVTFVVEVVLVLSNFLYDIFVFHLLGFECLNVRPKNGKNETI